MLHHITPNTIHLIIYTAVVHNTLIQYTMRSTKLIEHPYHQVRSIRTIIIPASFTLNTFLILIGAPSIGWNIPSNIPPSFTSPTLAGLPHQPPPPPLPPRNNNQKSDDYQSVKQENEVLDRRKVSAKLYENVVIKKHYEPELVAFFDMVQGIRSQYKYTDTVTNVGHVVAAEFTNVYPDETSIKLLVHPELTCLQNNLSASDRGSYFSQSSGIESSGGLTNDKALVDGYGAPIVFTCDSNVQNRNLFFSDCLIFNTKSFFLVCTTVEHVIMHVFCELEGYINGSVTDFMLKVIFKLPIVFLFD